MGVRSVWSSSSCGARACGLVLAIVAAPSCSTRSAELDATNDDAASESGDPEACHGERWTCTVNPDALGACGDGPTSELDEHCCKRAPCTFNGDCYEDETCYHGGIAEYSCGPVEHDGVESCECTILDPAPRRMCVPIDSLAAEWCEANATEEACRASETFTRTDGRIEGCGWFELTVLSLDADAGCTLGPSEHRCLTWKEDTFPCMGQTCRREDLGVEAVDGIARVLDGKIEILDIYHHGCAAYFPVGDGWAPVADIVGACAFTCLP